MSASVTMLRRLLAALVLAVTLPSWTAHADETPTIPRIGVLTAPYANAPGNEGLRDGLRELGYIEDKNIIIELRSGSTLDELRSAAADLVRSKADVIVVFSTPAARAAAATALPVVFLVGDPVSTGLAASLARPGGNATGVALIYTELTAKRLEILRLLAPRAQRIGCLMNSSNPASMLQFEAARVAAQTLGLELVQLNARNDAEVDDVVRALSRSTLDGVLLTGDLLLFANRAKLAGAIREAGLPASFPSREWHGDDVLLSYAPSISAAGRKMAVYVDQILRGARPADLPIEQLSTYELVIDLRVARAMGLDVPEDLLLRADEVIR
jgi:putative ABC transport system substrate-binding protein